jgi:hypothetical protein
MTTTSLQTSVPDEASRPYDECLALLADAVSQHDEARLDEVASLIGELAVVIELLKATAVRALSTPVIPRARSEQQWLGSSQRSQRGVKSSALNRPPAASCRQ